MPLVQITAIFYYLHKMSLFCYTIPYTSLVTLFGIWHPFLGCYDTFYNLQYLTIVIKVFTKGRNHILNHYNAIATHEVGIKLRPLLH